MPKTANARYGTRTRIIGQGFGSGSSTFQFALELAASTTVATPSRLDASGTYLNPVGGFTSTLPITWASTNYFNCQFFYEAA